MARPLYGLVLAGGQSRRMGQDKALLRQNGTTQLAHVAGLLGELLPRVFVSVRREQSNEDERARFAQIVDRYHDVGPVAGILSALQEHSEVDWLVVACDLPNVDASTIEYLCARADPAYPFTAFESSYGGFPEPLCAIYRCGSGAILQRFVDDGIVCPRKMLIRSNTQLLQQPDPTSLDNVNTPGDLEASVLEAST